MQQICFFMLAYKNCRDVSEAEVPFYTLLPSKDATTFRPATVPSFCLQASQFDWEKGYKLMLRDQAQYLMHAPSRNCVKLRRRGEWQLYLDDFARWTVWGGGDTEPHFAKDMFKSVREELLIAWEKESAFDKSHYILCIYIFFMCVCVCKYFVSFCQKSPNLHYPE